MSKDAPIMSDNRQPARGAGFYVRVGWVLTIVGAGSFFLWASLAPLDEGDIDVEEDATPSLALVSSDDDDGPGDDGGPETPRPPRRGNHLRVVK